MKTHLCLILCIVLTAYPLIAQDEVSYTYDQSGNRTEKSIIIGGLKSKSSNESINQEEVFLDRLDEVLIKIYPNPTTGKIKLICDNADKTTKINMRVFDLEGKEILHQIIHDKMTEIDLTENSPGTYFLIINVNDTLSRWKVIKN